eukprot:TRINITY_DN74251_c0_g1_i1.p1 TRINITY_DN74251_c0_g1~~TRINITY_DN74251_c0_g1_i1.p1  ORF type:complete len:1263 (+),score=274.05 TRINITY_DN74251_c0_g1_i1:114-3902(+)
MHKRKVVQYLGKYIRGLNTDQVKSHLLTGEFELRDAELDVGTLSGVLAGVVPYTLQVQSAVCEYVHVRVPWRALRSRPVRVRIGSCRAKVEVHCQDDIEWAKVAAEQLRESTVSSAASNAAKEGAACPPVKLSDIKMAVADGIEVSIASVELVLLSSAPSHQPRAKPHASVAGVSAGVECAGQELPYAPVPVWVLDVTNVSLWPSSADGSKAQGRPGSSRERGLEWSALRRQLTFESIAVRAVVAHGEAVASREEPALTVDDLVVDILEWRDAERGSANPANASGRVNELGAKDGKKARVAGFPREIRASVRLPRVEIRCCGERLAVLAAIFGDVAAPPRVPVEALSPESRHLHWRDNSTDAEIATRAAGLQAWKSRRSNRGGAGVQGSNTDEAEGYDCRGSKVTSLATNAIKTATVAQHGATVAASGALKGAVVAAASASAVATRAVTSAGAASSMAQRSAAAAANVAAGRATAGRRLAERTAAAAAAVATRGSMTSSASKAAVAARQVAADRAKGAASSLFRGKLKFQAPKRVQSDVTDCAVAGCDSMSIPVAAEIEATQRELENQAIAMGFEPQAVANVLSATGVSTIDDLVHSLVKGGATQENVGLDMVCEDVNFEDSLCSDVGDHADLNTSFDSQGYVESGGDTLEPQGHSERVLQNDARGSFSHESVAGCDLDGTFSPPLDPFSPVHNCDEDGDAAPVTISPDGLKLESTTLDTGDVTFPTLQAKQEEANEDESEEEDGEDDEDVEDVSMHAAVGVGSVRTQDPACARSATHTSRAGPPPLLRRIVTHLHIGTILIEMSVTGEASPEKCALAHGQQQPQRTLIVEAEAIDFTSDELRRLTDAEIRCLQLLDLISCQKDAATVGGGNGCLTLGAVRAWLKEADLSTSNLLWPAPALASGGVPLWLLTARWNRICSQMPSSASLAMDKGAVRAKICAHGVRAAADSRALQAVESLFAAVIEAVPSRKSCEAAVEAAHVPALPEFDISVLSRDVVLDLDKCSSLEQLRAVVPGVFVALSTADEAYEFGANGSKASDAFWLSSIPSWHSSVPSTAVVHSEPDFSMYGCVCEDGVAPRTLPSVGCGGSSPAACSTAHHQFVTERQWRVATQSSPSSPEVLVAEEEFMLLSNAKLHAVEQVSDRAAMAEAWRLRSSRVVGREAARRIPMVRELLDEGGPLEAQLHALQAEAISMEEDGKEDQLRLRTCEKEAAAAVATLLAQQAAHEEDLSRQLDNERSITIALEKLVQQQAATIEMLMVQG